MASPDEAGVVSCLVSVLSAPGMVRDSWKRSTALSPGGVGQARGLMCWVEAVLAPSFISGWVPCSYERSVGLEDWILSLTFFSLVKEDGVLF